MTPPALVCPFCRTRNARITTEGYSPEPGLREPEAKYMGLWRTREVGVCDQCDEKWGLASRGVPTSCPSCGSMNSGLFGYGVQRNCWACGTVWKSPPPRKPRTRLDRLGEAITMTAAFGFLAVVAVVGVFLLIVGVVFGVMLILFAPVLLIPLGLITMVVVFFYVTSRPQARKKPTQTSEWLSEPGRGDDESAPDL